MAEAIKEWDEPAAPPVATEVSGGDDVAVAEAPTEADAPAAPDDSTSRGNEDPLDRLLAQWDESNGAGNGAAAAVPTDDDIVRMLDEANQQAAHEQKFAAAHQRFAAESAQSAMDIAARDRMLAEAQQTIGSLQQTIAAEQWRQHQQQSREAFEKLVAAEQAKLADVPGVDEDHARRWLLSEAAQDPRLGEAWEVSRFYQPPGPLDRAKVAANIQQWAEGQAKLALQLPSPRARVLAQQNIEASMRQMWETAFPDPQQHRAAAAAYVRKAIDRMHKEARRPRIDPDVTADRLAVVQAMRGASTNKPPPEPPVNLGALTEGEFRRHTMERYGF